MGFKTNPGMWCDYCERPVAGQKATHRLRNIASGVTAPLTAGLTLGAMKYGEWHCPDCGQPVRRASKRDFEQLAAVEAEAAKPPPPPPPPIDPDGPPPNRDDYPTYSIYREAHAEYVAAKTKRRTAAPDSKPTPDGQASLESRMAKLELLATLLESGELSREDYEREKGRVIGGS